MSPSESNDLPDDDGQAEVGDFEFPGVTFVGAPLEPGSGGPTFGEVPEQLADLLGQVNGFVAFGGGLHVRGVCDEPEWHSLMAVWHCDGALHEHYQSVRPTDVPFGQDCLGDQFLLRDGAVLRLYAETDELEPVADDLDAFLALVQEDPEETLGLAPLAALLEEGESLQPGQLIHVWPPFCSEEAAEGVSIETVPVLERLRFLADFSRGIRDLEDGGTFEMKFDGE